MEDFQNDGLGQHFTIVLNNALRDKRLSWRAKGILAGCLSHKKSFRFTRSWIIEHGTEGRDAILSALSELRELGYLRNVKTRDSEGRMSGEHYVFTDKPRVSQPASGSPEQGDGASENQALGNRTTENQYAGKPVRIRRPVQEDQLEEDTRETPARQGRASIELPDWLEPCREPLALWLENRRKKHKLTPELSSSTMRALEYARGIGVLQIYCEYASERSWQSLGFVGYKETIDKLAKENGMAPSVNSKPTMSPIIYTLN